MYKKYNRKIRKKQARDLKQFFVLDKIPSAETKAIRDLCNIARKEIEYEKYAGW